MPKTQLITKTQLTRFLPKYTAMPPMTSDKKSVYIVTESVGHLSAQVSESIALEKSENEVVRLAQETLAQNQAAIKKSAKELVFKKFNRLLKNLA